MWLAAQWTRFAMTYRFQVCACGTNKKDSHVSPTKFLMATAAVPRVCPAAPCESSRQERRSAVPCLQAGWRNVLKTINNTLGWWQGCNGREREACAEILSYQLWKEWCFCIRNKTIFMFLQCESRGMHARCCLTSPIYFLCVRVHACACVRNLSPNNDTDQWMTSATNACHCKTLILCNTPRQMVSLLTYLWSLLVYTVLFITVQSAICHSTAKTVAVSFVCRTFSVLEMKGLLSTLLLLAIVSVCQVKLNTWINYISFQWMAPCPTASLLTITMPVTLPFTSVALDSSIRTKLLHQ